MHYDIEYALEVKNENKTKHKGSWNRICFENKGFSLVLFKYIREI
jgi:hypothetical protein